MKKTCVCSLILLLLCLLPSTVWAAAADLPIPNIQHERQQPLPLQEDGGQEQEGEEYYITPLAVVRNDDTPGQIMLSLLLMGVLIVFFAVGAVVMIYRTISRDKTEEEEQARGKDRS